MLFRRRRLLSSLALLSVVVLALALDYAPARATHRVLQVDHVAIRLDMTGQRFRLPDTAFERWIRHATRSVGSYYGRFPLDGFALELRGRAGRGVGSGHAYSGRRLRVNIGRRADAGDLASDWVMVHEMLHLVYPRMHRRHRWMREGLSTYLEPIIRARAGDLTERQVWERWTERLHNGLPRRGDRGLDRTPTWGRVYWGGTLFWLLADVEIRRATDNERSIEHALRAVVVAGGTGRVRWPVERALRIGDRATGTTVLLDLYRRLANTPVDVDLDELYRELGVSDASSGFDDSAPLAHVRRGITRPRSN